MKICPNCGAQLDDSAIFCTTCGAKLDGFQQQPQQVLHHRRLTGAAHRQVSHTESRHIDGARQQQMPVKQHMADSYADGVEPT